MREADPRSLASSDFVKRDEAIREKRMRKFRVPGKTLRKVAETTEAMAPVSPTVDSATVSLDLASLDHKDRRLFPIRRGELRSEPPRLRRPRT